MIKLFFLHLYVLIYVAFKLALGAAVFYALYLILTYARDLP